MNQASGNSPLEMKPGWICQQQSLTILERIAVSNQSVVYKARQELLGRTVALKVTCSGQQVDLIRFQREAQILQALDHPNAGRVFGYGQLDGHSYMLMEWLEGKSLAQLLQLGPVDEELIAAIVRAVASALTHAHAIGIVHRDIKPSNIFVEQTDCKYIVRLIDFGIARLLDVDQKLTATGALLGSPAYMSPEQCGQSVIDGRSDIYSLGCVLYECVAGGTVFSGASPMEVMYKHLHEEPSPIPGNRALSAVILKCLAKDPERRYQTPSDLLKDWEAVSHADPKSTESRRDKKFLSLVAIALGFGLASGMAFLLANSSKPSYVRVKTESFDDAMKRLLKLEAEGPKLEYVQECERLENATRTPLDMMKVYRLHFVLNNNLKRPEQSLGIARRVALLCDKAPDDILVTLTMQSAANVLRELKQYGEAEDLYKKSIRKRLAIRGGRLRYDLGCYRMDYALLLGRLNRFEEERKLMEEALADLLADPPDTYASAEARNFLARNALNRKNYGEAARLCEIALRSLTPDITKNWDRKKTLEPYIAEIRRLQQEIALASKN